MLFLSTALVADDRISLMTYNVENLFDTSHDEGKDDYTYLPQSLKKGALKDQVNKSCRSLSSPVWRKDCFELDWNDELLGIKMQQIGSVVRQIQTSRGNGPDLLFMQEVENFNVFKQFVESQTPDAGYYGVLLEASDPRGIDSAFLSRFPISQKRAPQLHPIITESGSQLARGVLEVTVDLPDGTPLTALVFHFPAAYHPTDKREAALRTLNQIRETIPSSHIVVAGGDSNITNKEENKNGLLRNIIRPFWTLIEDFCEGCAGTEYYEKEKTWSFFDRFMVSQGGAGRAKSHVWNIDSNSARVVTSAPGQIDFEGHPIRFNPDAKNGEERGMSDHLPFTFDLIKQ